jgi:hypothetical protein
MGDVPYSILLSPYVIIKSSQIMLATEIDFTMLQLFNSSKDLELVIDY